jgi:hypothetical protein
MTLTQAHRPGGGHPTVAIVAAHRALIAGYVKQRRHLEKDNVKSYRRIVVDLGGLMNRHTIRRYMRALFPEIAAEIRRLHTTPAHA